MIDALLHGKQVLEILRADHTARLHVNDDPGTRTRHEVLPLHVFQLEITEIEQTVQPLMPGIEPHVVPPARRIDEMEMHPGQDPGTMVDMQVIITESQTLGGPIGDFLGQVHERRRFQEKRGIGVIAGDTDVLKELVTFFFNVAHTCTTTFAVQM